MLFTGLLCSALHDEVNALRKAVAALAAAEASEKPSLRALGSNVWQWLSLFLLALTAWADHIKNWRKFTKLATYKSWANDTAVQFALKQYVIISTCFVILVVVTSLHGLLGSPYGGWIVVSFVVVMQPSVESTAQRWMLRVVATVLGCALSYAIIVSPTTGSSPGIITAYIFVLCLVSLTLLDTYMSYGVVIFCIRFFLFFFLKK